MGLAILSFAHLHAEAYVHNLRAIPDVEFIGFADDDPARGKHFSERYDAHLFESYDALLAEQPDGVVVCSENARHRPLVEQAAAAGVHVLSEKPLATTIYDAQAMICACEEAGVRLMTAFPMRFSAPVRAVKTMIDDHQLGHVYGCSATNQGQLPLLHTAYPRGWFIDRTLAGGGAAADHTVHVADLLRWLLGSEVTEVYADLHDIFYHDQVDGVETGGLVMLTFANGAFASIDCSWSKPPNYPTWGGLTMELVGEKGMVSVDGFKQISTVYNAERPRPYWTYWGSDANQSMIDEFAAAIREQRDPAVTGHDGFKAVEIVDAVYRSASSGHPVALPAR